MDTDGSSSGEIDSLLGDRPSICRSGSAPPTVEGSRAAARSFSGIAAGEDEMRSDPHCSTRCYSNGNLKPRFPPPGLSREHWRVAQRLGLDSDSDSLFSFQPPTCNGGSLLAKTGTDGLIGSRDVGVGDRKKSFADVLQQDLGSATSTSGHLSRPVSHNAFDKICDPMESSNVRSFGSTSSQSFASNSGFSIARSKTTYPQLISRSSNPDLPLMVGSASDTDKIFVSNVFDDVTPCNDTTISLSGLKLSDKIIQGQNHVEEQYPRDSHDIPSYEQYIWQKNRNMAENESSVTSVPLQAYRDLSKKTDSLRDVGLSTSSLNEQPNLSRPLSTDFYRKLQTGINSYTRSSDCHTAITNAAFAGCQTNPCSGNQGIPIVYKKQPNAADDMGGEYGNRTASLVGSGFQILFVDQHYARYQPRACNLSNAGLSDPSLGRYYSDTSLVDIPGYQEACLQAYLAQRNYHYDEPLGKYGSFYNGLCGDLGMRYPSHLSGSLLSSLALRNPVRQNEHLLRLRSIYRSASGVSKEPWNHEGIIAEDGFLTLLEELKNNRTRSFELSEIVGHVVEFSTDQYGSRFIQQKLETASVEEKNKIFPEILPCARELMVDVFGNYVIQKFFELGTKSQKNQLVDQLIGYVLHLSLQMYGCRVIQKALQVVDVGQQTQMVSEFDGSVMKCVRDQNGNHVIQKCIECVPRERIQFIMSSFYGQVVSLSTHPYGCRVIQRILEHCDDIETQTIMINEILHSVCSLAQDQYGNYVVQHVLQHGKQEERSAIIKKLTGEIVKMSQQKFASNVVEKCLTYCNSEERQNIITEMLSSTDENEPLQAMMKDQFGNYVVQKVLETCDDRNRVLILSRIKLHLNALKKYTYGKHIVSHAEKLITGERRIVGL